METATAPKKDLYLKAKALLDSGKAKNIGDASQQVGINASTFYAWKKKDKKTKAVLAGGRRRGPDMGPQLSRPRTIHVPPLVPSSTCPPGYVMVMVPVSSLAALLGGEQ